MRLKRSLILALLILASLAGLGMMTHGTIGLFTHDYNEAEHWSDRELLECALDDTCDGQAALNETSAHAADSDAIGKWVLWILGGGGIIVIPVGIFYLSRRKKSR